MKTCAFYTLGCKVNQYETQGIRENFIKAGYKETDFNEPCDVYVINTCTVTEKTDKESRRLIRKAYKQNPEATVVVTGCYAELDSDEISASPGTSFIIRNEDKGRIVDIIDSTPVRPLNAHNLAVRRWHLVRRKHARQKFEKSLKSVGGLNGATIIPPVRTKGRGYFDLAISDFKDRSKAFLKIQDGCNNFCSYCKVPLVRGYSKSRSEKAIIAECERLVKKGFREIILTGICVGAWGEELTHAPALLRRTVRGTAPKNRLADLLKKLTAIKGDFRIRLSSIEPKYVDDRLLEVIKKSPKLCRHLHIPLQSGDDKILKIMNRPYTFREYVRIVQNAARKIPGIAITTDILIGFPSESDKNFRNTLKLIKKIKPSRIHIFPYSRRVGTVAANLPHEIPKSIVLKRMKTMNALKERYSYEYRKKFVGKIAKVLVEDKRDRRTGLLKGYDDKYINIIIKRAGPKEERERVSQIVNVRIQKVDKGQTFGTAI